MTRLRSVAQPSEASDPADPFTVLSAEAKLVVSALRGRHRGASVEVLASDAALDPACVNDCLRALGRTGLAERSPRLVAAFHIPRPIDIWALTGSAWACLRWMPARLPAAPTPCGGDDRALPVEMWPVFWSGQRVEQMRLPRDAARMCEAMLQAPMPEARIWAMLHLPAQTLLASRHRSDPLLRRLVAARS